MPITTSTLEEKAKQFADVLENPIFKVTNGWLYRWKARYNIKYKKAYGEKNDADLESANTWTATVLSEILDNLEPRNIYNADETGIYYRALPDGTLAFATEKLSGSKKAKMAQTSVLSSSLERVRTHVVSGEFSNCQLPTPTTQMHG